jgi:ribosomal-protein-alanine N-acetyltransferase
VRPPVLETARLTLRPFTPADAPAVQRLAGAREVADTTRQIPHPYADGMAEAWIATHAGLHDQDRALTLAVEIRAERRLCGAIGLRLKVEDRHAELGYWIGAADWARGFCTEAARAVVAHGFGALDLHRIYATYFARNRASGRVMEKLGMTREGCLREHVRKWGVFEDLIVRGILREEWLLRQTETGGHHPRQLPVE